MARLAWFSPMPPARTGVAIDSVEMVGALAGEHEIHVFVDEPIAAHYRNRSAGGRLAAAAMNARFPPAPIRSAHEFVWSHHRHPYDLTVFQLGNSSAHDFLWPYLFKYPGVAVLHDSHLHHARAAALLRARRADDYRSEFTANHPAVSPDLAELAIAGFDNHLYYSWPMTRLVVRGSRLAAVHAPLAAQWLREQSPGIDVETIRLGHGELVGPERAAISAARVRARHGIPDAALLFGVFGGLTPEKRVPAVLEAFAALLRYQPSARLILAGAPAGHYDVEADVRRLGLGDTVIISGYIESDEAFTDYVSACDVSINLRWPTAREISGPWLRALSAGRPTITMDLAHTAGVPALDPRTWLTVSASTSLADSPVPVTVGIDIMDEQHSLRLALRRLASDGDLRQRLGRAAAAYWEREHSQARMLEDYRRVLERALDAPVPVMKVPAHLRQDGLERLHALLEPFGGDVNPWSRT